MRTGTGQDATAKNFPLDRDQLLPIKSRETSPTDKQSNKWAALVTSQVGASSDEQRKTDPGNNSLLTETGPSAKTVQEVRVGGCGYPPGQQ